MTGSSDKRPLFIYESQHYGVALGESELNLDKFPGDSKIYKIVNKTYNVTEVETTVLPTAIAECNAMSEELDLLLPGHTGAN